MLAILLQHMPIGTNSYVYIKIFFIILVRDLSYLLLMSNFANEYINTLLFAYKRIVCKICVYINKQCHILMVPINNSDCLLEY